MDPMVEQQMRKARQDYKNDFYTFVTFGIALEIGKVFFDFNIRLKYVSNILLR